MIKTDLLVIGSGAAGMTATVYAATAGIQVLVIDKGVVARSGSTVGAVQIAATGQWVNNGKDKDTYFEDIMNSGRGLSHPKLARILAEEIEQVLQDFVSWGLAVDRDQEGQPMLFDASGHQVARSLSAKKGKSGLGLLQTLTRQANQHTNIQRRSDCIVTQLCKEGDQVVGAIVYDLQRASFLFIQCKAIVLACGGIGQLYPMTSNPVQSTGDGYSLALQAGATLLDMEQVQFYPVNVLAPRSLKGLCISFYHLAKLYNRHGERFMEKYEPENLENVTRDKMAYAISSEILAGRGTDEGGVWLDATEIIPYIQAAFPEEYELCLQKGIDLKKDRIQVAPAAHFMMGGVAVDEQGWTGISGLYAVGETAGGLHGGNRLANNALSECIVFGARVGRAASQYADNCSFLKETYELERSLPLTSNGEDRPYRFKDQIREIMVSYAGVLRNGSGLTKAEEELNNLSHRLQQIHIPGSERPFSRDVLDCFEAQHMLLTAKAIVGSAKQRKESVGAHQRLDAEPATQDIEHILVEYKNGQLLFRKERRNHHAECTN